MRGYKEYGRLEQASSGVILYLGIMSDRLPAKVASTLARYGMLGSRPDASRVLVAVSGGPDSVALFFALRELSRDLGFTVAVAHLDHGLRKQESADDRSFVEKMAREAGVHCISHEVPITVGSENWEAKARRARYAFLRWAAGVLGCDRIATGHTLDDQAETVLMRIVAGTGPGGLVAIRPVNGCLIRPLIDCTRQDVWRFLREDCHEFRHDLTNYDLCRARNRARHLVLPLLEGMFNKNVRLSLARLAELAAAEDQFLDELAARASESVRDADNRLAVGPLLALPAALRRRVVRRWLASLGARRPTAAQSERVLELAARGGPAGSVSLGGVRVTYELGFLGKSDSEEGLLEQVPYSYSLSPGSEVEVKEAGVAISLSRRMKVSEAPSPGLEVCVADASLLPSSLSVRNRRRGDRLYPIGMEGSKELKEVLREARVPRARRGVLPIVCAREEILWIPGVARSRVALVNAATEWVVVARVRQH